MKLSENMNWIDMGKWIIEQIEKKVNRDAIELQMMKKFRWSLAQTYSATDPYFEEKRYIDSDNKVRRR